MTRLSTITAAVAFTLAAVAPQAKADVIGYNGFSELNSRTVTLSGPVNLTAGAGQVTFQNVTGFSGILSTFCVDVYHYLQSAGSFTTGTFLSGTFGTTVNALMSHVLPTLATDPDASAALQVAIWRAEYSSLTVSAPSAVDTLATTYLTNVSNGTWMADLTKAVAFLDGGGSNQNQAYLTSVPEPASVMLVAAGLMGITLMRRRRG